MMKKFSFFKKNKRKLLKKIRNIRKDWVFNKKIKENKKKSSEKRFNFKNKFKEKIDKYNDKISGFLNFIFFISGYGLIINFMVWGLFSFEFSIITLYSYGIFAYFVREELVLFIRRILGK